MTTNLTPEQIADGWRNISEIVNEPNYNKDDVADIQLAFIPVNGSKKGKFKITHELHYSSDAELFVPKDDFMGDIYFYRRLIPALPSQVDKERIATLEEALINATELIEQLHYEHLYGMGWLEGEENKYRAIAGVQDNETK